MAPTTHTVRVIIREITYAAKDKNLLDQDVIVHRTAYGPGRPEIDPARNFGPDVDPESSEYKDAVVDYRLGQQVELLDEDYIRLSNGGAVKDADAVEAMAVESDEEVLDVRTASVDDLARWIEQEGPNVNETVQASGGEAELAQKLLEAETQATDGEPRQGVVDGLSTVIGRGD